MIGDFFSQLARPIPPEFFSYFTDRTMSIFPNAKQLIQRAQLLRPVYQIKWCCIALNIFLPHHLARRTFANPNLNVLELKNTQLEKVKILMNNLLTLE